MVGLLSQPYGINRKDNMNIFFSLALVLVGFILTFLAVITLIHSSHYVVAVLLMFGGVVMMFEGLPKHE